MFWVDSLGEDHCYCICQSAWQTMEIVYANIHKNFIEIYITPEDGNRCCVYKHRKTLNPPTIKEFRFDGWEHAKIEVIGGEITMMGTSDDEKPRYKSSIHFTGGCPFGNEEDWMYNAEKLQVIGKVKKMEKIETSKNISIKM